MLEAIIITILSLILIALLIKCYNLSKENNFLFMIIDGISTTINTITDIEKERNKYIEYLEKVIEEKEEYCETLKKNLEIAPDEKQPEILLDKDKIIIEADKIEIETESDKGKVKSKKPTRTRKTTKKEKKKDE
mgnify:CR=1 FL=1